MSESAFPPAILCENDEFISAGGQDFRLNACVGRQLPDYKGTNHYSEGFRVAARCLAEQVIEARNCDGLYVDIMIYPVFFLYRHAFELQLKLIIRAGLDLSGTTGTVQKTHKLADLWNDARPLLEAIFPDLDWTQNNHVSRLIGEFSILDPNGEAGRYDRSRKGEKHFAHLATINLHHFAQVAEKLCDYFDEVMVALEETIDQRNDWACDR
ncbi:MAG: hypothetical protein HC888_10450 [Candidatus Competibacteraceae bacterium]|nr:hypothetical protein [Candidatus Competibacteraceae bacterium]